MFGIPKSIDVPATFAPTYNKPAPADEFTARLGRWFDMFDEIRSTDIPTTK